MSPEEAVQHLDGLALLWDEGAVMQNDRGDLKLGWLEAFVATAHHLDFRLAADQLGVDAITAQRGVENLEVWLRKLLVLDDGPLELYEVDGTRFLNVASKILHDFNSFRFRGVIPDGPSPIVKSSLSNIRLSELEALLSIAEHKNYKASAYELQCSSDRLRRTVKKLEDTFGCEFVAGRTHLELTDEGHRFADLAKDTATALRGSVADISGHDPDIRHLKNLRNIFIRRSAELSVIIARAERKVQPRKHQILTAQAAKDQLVLIDRSLNEIQSLLLSKTGKQG